MPEPKDPFDGFFDSTTPPITPDNGLLAPATIQRQLQHIHASIQGGWYPYQQALEAKSGIHSRFREQSLQVLSAYDYLGLIGHPSIEAAAQAAIAQYGTGTGGVRLLTGTTELHWELERRLADCKGTEAAMTFSSGYLANMAVLTALFGKRDLVLADQFVHHSLIDGLKLAGVPYRHFAHNDTEALEELLRRENRSRRILILAEGTYSMDGDCCPLPELVALKQKYQCLLMIDEAHSFGVLGHQGRGVTEHFGVAAEAVDIFSGSLSKAIPANGGFIAGSRALIYYLQHSSGPYIFSAALAPPCTAAARAALDVIETETWRRERLRGNSDYLRQGLRKLGFTISESARHVIPVPMGDRRRAFEVTRYLLERGFLVTPVVFPAVPRHAARLRLCASAEHSTMVLDEALQAFAAVRNRFFGADAPAVDRTHSTDRRFRGEEQI